MPARLSANRPAEGFVRLVTLTPFSAYAVKQGVDIETVSKDFGVDPRSLTNPDVFVHGEVIYGMLNAYAREAKDPYLGLHVGEWLDIASWPPFFDAARSARTLGEFFSSEKKSLGPPSLRSALKAVNGKGA